VGSAPPPATTPGRGPRWSAKLGNRGGQQASITVWLASASPRTAATWRFAGDSCVYEMWGTAAVKWRGSSPSGGSPPVAVRCPSHSVGCSPSCGHPGYPLRTARGPNFRICRPSGRFSLVAVGASALLLASPASAPTRQVNRRLATTALPTARQESYPGIQEKSCKAEMSNLEASAERRPTEPRGLASSCKTDGD